MEFGDDAGGFTMWGNDWAKPGVAITRPHDGQPHHRGNGHMTALVVDSRDLVDALHAKALALGGTVVSVSDRVVQFVIDPPYSPHARPEARQPDRAPPHTPDAVVSEVPDAYFTAPSSTRLALAANSQLG